MNRIRFGLILGVALAAQGCGSDSKGDATVVDPTMPPTGTKTVGFEFTTGQFTIQPGENFECFYTDTITTMNINVNNATAMQGKGGHHVTVYYTDQKVPVGHHPCIDVEMAALHEIAGAANGSEGIVSLPDGYATKVPVNKQIVVQSHYISTAQTATTVEDKISLETLADADVKQYANSFSISDGSFNIAPRAMGTSTTDCVVPQDFDIIVLLGHMHELGSHYKLSRMTAAGQLGETIYETDWQPSFMSHPPVTKYDPATPMKLHKGETIRQTCDWKNTSDTAKAFPDEMCVMFTYYVPDNGFLVCDNKVVK